MLKLTSLMEYVSAYWNVSTLKFHKCEIFHIYFDTNEKYSVSLKPFANFRIFIWMKNQTAMKQEGTLPSNYSTQPLFNVQAISILNILYACKWRISSTEEKKGKESWCEFHLERNRHEHNVLGSRATAESFD